jgi:hypothetical protein
MGAAGGLPGQRPHRFRRHAFDFFAAAVAATAHLPFGDAVAVMAVPQTAFVSPSCSGRDWRQQREYQDKADEV